jgi:hypothetical protein
MRKYYFDERAKSAAERCEVGWSDWLNLFFVQSAGYPIWVSS